MRAYCAGKGVYRCALQIINLQKRMAPTPALSPMNMSILEQTFLLAQVFRTTRTADFGQGK